ncbi:MAG: hypothetical protein ACXU89_10155, partial [Xanthobacteraceae bacterium]
MDHIALVDAQFQQAAGELGIDVDLVRFDAAVARDDARGQAVLGLLPPIVSATGRSRTEQNDGKRDFDPSPARGRWNRGRQRRRSRSRHGLARGGKGLGDALGRASGHILQRLVLRSGFLNQNSSPCDAPNNN